MNRVALAGLCVLWAVSVFASDFEGPRPFDAQLIEAPDQIVNVKLDDRLPDATAIYFVVEVFNSVGKKVAQFGTRADVPVDGAREVSLRFPRRMATAKSITVWASGYRGRNSDKVVPVRYPPECGSFCLVGRNECNLFCAEQNSNVAMYRCYSDGYYCYYDCLCY